MQLLILGTDGPGGWRYVRETDSTGTITWCSDPERARRFRQDEIGAFHLLIARRESPSLTEIAVPA